MKRFNHYTKDLEVVFVEKDNELRNAFTTLFQRFFRVVNAFDNADDAFLFYQENEKYIDIVITELILRGSTGIELCKKIKELNGDQKVIVISTCDDQDLLGELEEMGISDYLLKPPLRGHLEKLFKRVGQELYEHYE